MPAGLIAVVIFMGSLFVREVGYLTAKHHQDKKIAIVALNK